MTGIYDASGTKIGEYTYDAWGNCSVTYGIGKDVVRNNPIRYRSYYYDKETNLYYLNARYYDPALRRFISLDSANYLDPDTPNGLNLYAYCNNDPVNYADPNGNFPILASILCGISLIGMGLTIGGVATDNDVMTAIGLKMVAVPALISGGGAIATGATYLGIIGGVTSAAGAVSGLFAVTEYIEAFTGNNWMMTAGMSEKWYNGLLLATAALATIGTVSCGILSSIGKATTPNQMMNSLSKHPNRWKQIDQLKEAATGKKYIGGDSYYTKYVNRWTGARGGTHIITRNGIIIHGPHFHL